MSTAALLGLSPAARRRRRAWAALWLLGAALVFAGLGSTALLTKNEGRRAGAIAAMTADGDWLIPHLNGAPYLEKPPLYYWLGTAAAHLRGAPDEWAVRAPAALGALALVLTVYLLLRRSAGAQAARYGVLTMLVCIAVTALGRRAHIEPVLAAVCFGALAAAARYVVVGGSRAWLDGAWALLGLAILTKGPVALLFVAAPLLASAVHLRSPRAWQAAVHPRGWLLMGVLGASWYLAVMHRLGPDAFAHVAAKDLAGKVWSTNRHDPLWSYPLWLVRDLAPASLLVLAAPRRAWRTWRSSPLGVLMLYGVVVPVAVLSAFDYKHAKYLNPALPAGAVLLALHWQAWRLALPARMRPWPVRAGAALLLALTVYRVAIEPRVYAARTSGLLELARALRDPSGPPAHAWREVDARLPYYVDAPVPVLKNAAALRARAAQGPLRVVVDSHTHGALPDPGACRLYTFAPYLEAGRRATVMQFGALCLPAGPARR